MEEPERRQVRRDILAEMGELLRETFAAGSWGRMLVEVRRAEGTAGRVVEGVENGEPPLVVADLQIEEVTAADEAVVDAAFGSEAAHHSLGALAQAVEALCALDGVDAEDVGGGTFVRVPDAAAGEPSFAFLPGPVRTPSARFDAERDGAVSSVSQKLDAHGLRADGLKFRLDLGEGRIELEREGATRSATAVVIGAFAAAHRVWTWGAYHEELSDARRRESARLVDGMLARDAWEISTPTFVTDEATAWALAAWVCEQDRGDGLLRIQQPDGALFVMLRELGS